jgi:outer membrane protein assembly factor BamA
MLVFARGKIEGRYLDATRRWDGVLADGRLHVYTELGPRAYIALSAGGAGGWNTRTPFQLLLGGPDGIRGYGLATLPVGRRIVLQGEHRYFLGTVLGVADVGTAAFVDVGRGWAGDAAFGADTGVRAAAGVGLRFAVPRGSRRTYRLDVAVPLARGHGVEVQVALNQQFGVFRGEPADVARSREQVSSTSIFNYPRF